jgi:dTDP-4-dehydrorhamnose 3,5-epimerase
MGLKMNYSFSKIFGKDVAIIQPEVFHDFRGEYIETWNIETYKIFGALEFKQDDISASIKHTLRGIHGDARTWKLIQCLYGALFQVIVDMRPESDTYLKWESFILNDKNRTQILIPPMFGNAHLVMSDFGIFSYKQTTLYEGAEKQFTVRWDDPKLDIPWPIKDPLLSQRDLLVKDII